MPADYTEGFAVREPSWHGLERLLQDYPTLGAYGTGDPERDPYILSGHDFDLEEAELFQRLERETPGGRLTTFPKLTGFRAIRNSKTGEVFQVAKDSWSAIPNTVGWELAQLLVDSDPNVKVATAAVLGGGATCFLLLELDEPFTVPGDNSTIRPYVNVHWSHDGTGALKGFRTYIRTVCRNTLDLGLEEAGRAGVAFSIRHTKNVAERIEDVKAALSGVRSETETFKALAADLGAVRFTEAQRELFITTLIPEPVGDVVSEKVRENITRDRNKVRALLTPGSATIPEEHQLTGYGMVQAGVEYLDWLRGYRNSETLFGRQLLRTEPLKQKLVPMVRELAAV